MKPRLRDCAFVIVGTFVLFDSIVGAGVAADALPASAVALVLGAAFILMVIGLAREEGR